ncbi:MAG: hypothetical protein AAFO51_00525 [Pseudomonadota bacterium]
MRGQAVGLAAAAALLAAQCAEARPVSYPGGWTFMQRNSGDYSSLHLHYSPTFQDSVGLYVEDNWTSDWRYAGIQYNRLVKRWNRPGSQANIYFNASAGYADADATGDGDLAGFVGGAADWETRRWFTSYQLRALNLGFDQDFRQAARIGVAPYIGDYGDLHTWLMVDVEHQPEADAPVTVTPLVRFFYGVQLVEIGYTPETERFLANWIVRF